MSATILTRLNACDEAINWYGTRDAEAAWAECQRGDWMLWIAARLDVERKLIVLAACDCAEAALRYVQDGEDRPRLAIETARKWVAGDATIEDVRIAHAASIAATADTAAAVNYDAYAASIAAAAAAHAASIAAAAAHAASIAATAARHSHLSSCADIVRNRISWDVMQAAIEAAGGDA